MSGVHFNALTELAHDLLRGPQVRSPEALRARARAKPASIS